jgi:hypothetical protein
MVPVVLPLVEALHSPDGTDCQSVRRLLEAGEKLLLSDVRKISGADSLVRPTRRRK